MTVFILIWLSALTLWLVIHAYALGLITEALKMLGVKVFGKPKDDK